MILAAGFAVLVDLLLLSSFVWVELLRPLDLLLGWMAAGALWGGSAIVSISRRRPAAEAGPTDLLFRQALTEYLQGSWFEAEAILGRLLRLSPRDAEGRLLLATVLGRAKRHDEALDQLDRLERLRDAAAFAVRCGELCTPALMEPLAKVARSLEKSADQLAAAT